ncbi:hypothetical protein C0991_007900, partial [Blastosporella zonata]
MDPANTFARALYFGGRIKKTGNPLPPSSALTRVKRKGPSSNKLPSDDNSTSTSNAPARIAKRAKPVTYVSSDSDDGPPAPATKKSRTTRTKKQVTPSVTKLNDSHMFDSNEPAPTMKKSCTTRAKKQAAPSVTELDDSNMFDFDEPAPATDFDKAAPTTKKSRTTRTKKPVALSATKFDGSMVDSDEPATESHPSVEAVEEEVNSGDDYVAASRLKKGKNPARKPGETKRSCSGSVPASRPVPCPTPVPVGPVPRPTPVPAVPASRPRPKNPPTRDSRAPAPAARPTPT